MTENARYVSYASNPARLTWGERLAALPTPPRSDARRYDRAAMMNRRRLLGLLGVGVLAAPVVADAQPAARLPRVGFIGTMPSAYSEAVKQGLSELGYVENKTVELDFRYSGGKAERFPEIAAALVTRGVDVLIASSEPATRAAMQATTTIPIVMLVADDPVTAGLVPSLTRPGGNMTGISTFIPDLVGKRLQLLQELVPRASRVAVLGHGADPAVGRAFLEAERAGAVLRLAVEAYKVREPTDLEPALAAITKSRPDGLLVLQNFWMFPHRAKVAEFAARSGLPAVYGLKDYVTAGGLIAYAPDFIETYGRAGHIAGKILKGAKPGDLPIERSTKFEMTVNLKTAKGLGLAIPQAGCSGRITSSSDVSGGSSSAARPVG
jgi:putative tryptophan/tyrosine transport system substrate-binding protein